MEPTVWLIQQPKGIKKDGTYWEPDLSSATKFGKIIPLLEPNDRPSLLPAPTYRKMETGLCAYSPGDYFLWAGGDPCALFMAGSIAQRLGYPDVQFLRWERSRNEYGQREGGYYIPVTLRFGRVE